MTKAYLGQDLGSHRGQSMARPSGGPETHVGAVHVGRARHKETVLVRCVIWGQCTCWNRLRRAKTKTQKAGSRADHGSSGHPSLPAATGLLPGPVHTGSQHPEAYW